MRNPDPRYPVFFIFLLANSLLSYGAWTLGARLGIGLLGLVLPFLWFWRRSPKSATPTLGPKEFLPAIPLWGWGLLGLAALIARFSYLNSLMVWPNFDESSYGFDAYQMVRGEPPRLFYGVSQAPPLYVWGLALFFKLFGVSLTTLHLFPGLISLAAVPLAYTAARTFFSRSFSFLCAVLTAVSFWPVFLGRFSLMTVLILPMELLALGGVGRFFQAKTINDRKGAAWGIGVVWGIGLYTHLHWPVVVAITALPLAFWSLKNWRSKPEFVGTLAARALGSALLLDLPLALGAIHQHYGGYLAHLWAFHRDFSWTKQLAVWASCLTSPFWGIDTSVHTYQPEWGGFLNPVLASLFFLGLGRAREERLRPLFLFLGGAYFLGLMPGLLTQDMETFRLFPLVPILIAGVSLGFTSLAETYRPARNLALALSLLLASIALDSAHLFGFYHRIWDNPASWGFYTKSIGRYRAFGILEEKKGREGPGYIFPDFVQGLPDQSLAVATYDYNAALNPTLPPAHWAAVLANVNYKPFLDTRFPHATAYALSKDFIEPDGGWMLYVFPLGGKSDGEIVSWVQAQKALEKFIDQDLCYVMGQPFDQDLKVLESLEPQFQGDPFLRSAYLEKKADLETKQALMEMTTLGPNSNTWKAAIESQQKAVEEGYPAAHFYEHLGVLWLMGKDPVRAEDAFRKALTTPPNLTDAAQYLDTLGAGRKRSNRP